MFGTREQREADKGGVHRDKEKGKHFIRFCEITEGREREWRLQTVEMQREAATVIVGVQRLKMRPSTTKDSPKRGARI